MPIKYKLNLLSALKDKGYTTYRIRKDKLLSESTVQKLRAGDTSLALDNLATVCKLLECQPGELIEYVPDEPAPIADDDDGNAVEVKADADESEIASEDSEKNTVISDDGNADLSNAPDSTTTQTEEMSAEDLSEPVEAGSTEDAGKRRGRKRGKLLAKAARL